MDSIDELNNSLYIDLNKEHRGTRTIKNISSDDKPFKEIETNIVYDDHNYIYLDCAEIDFCDYITERRQSHKYKMNINFFKQFRRPYTWSYILLQKINQFIKNSMSSNKEILTQFIYGFNIIPNDIEYNDITEKDMALNILQVGINLNKLKYYKTIGQDI